MAEQVTMAEGLLELGRDAQRFMDDLCDQLTVLASAPAPALACRAGCAWCCYLLVSVAPPEALLIAETLRTTLDPAALDEVTARVVELDRVSRGLAAQERFNLRRPCALLVDNRCSIYPVRPILCRGWTSYDAAQCEQALRQAEDNLAVDNNAQIRQAAAEVEQQLLATSREMGLPTEQLELTAALRIALETPDAAVRWARGEDLFRAARETPPPERGRLERAGRRRGKSSARARARERRQAADPGWPARD
jgi:Fe-S-cluster containining protein